MIKDGINMQSNYVTNPTVAWKLRGKFIQQKHPPPPSVSDKPRHQRPRERTPDTGHQAGAGLRGLSGASLGVPAAARGAPGLDAPFSPARAPPREPDRHQGGEQTRRQAVPLKVTQSFPRGQRAGAAGKCGSAAGS